MRIRIVTIVSIPDEELEEIGIPLDDEAQIQEFFYDQGGVEEFEHHVEEFNIRH